MIITLTTDFGTVDTFVGQMKGVLLSHVIGLTLVDITHDLPPQDVRQGALALESLAGLFPPGTIHLAIVDPGVGTSRRGIAVRTDRAVLIGPDNGLFSLYLERERAIEAVELSNPALHRSPVSPTFHGRDVFASVAGQLASGMPFEQLGRRLDPEELLRIPMPKPMAGPGSVAGQVIAIDRFGNLITNLTPSGLGNADRDSLRFQVAGQAIVGLKETYAQVGPRHPVAYVGSGGRIEIAVRDDDAARLWEAAIGMIVEVSITTF